MALREATEESGLHRFEILNKTVFDLDVHKIPKICSDLSHFHYDVRFLLEADPEKEPIIVSKESYDVAWVPIENVLKLNSEKSIHRMVDKTMALLM